MYPLLEVSTMRIEKQVRWKEMILNIFEHTHGIVDAIKSITAHVARQKI